MQEAFVSIISFETECVFEGLTFTLNGVLAWDRRNTIMTKTWRTIKQKVVIGAIMSTWEYNFLKLDCVYCVV